MLYIIGLGLGDEKDITIKGAEAISKCEHVFLEAYTSILGVSTEKLEATYGKKVKLAHRETVESEAETILEPAKVSDVAFLVVGDPFGATTHTDLLIRAQEMGIKTQVIHNASIMNACGASGLQLYNFGQTISIPFFRKEWRPDSFFGKIAYNAGGGMHTLALLDIKVREPNFESLVRTGKTTYDPPRYMSINTAIAQLLEVEINQGSRGICGPDAFGIGIARVGQDTQCIVSGTLKELSDVDFGPPLHSLVLVGAMHDLEKAMFDHFRVKAETPRLDAQSLARATRCGNNVGAGGGDDDDANNSSSDEDQ